MHPADGAGNVVTLDVDGLTALIAAHGSIARILVVDARGSVPRGAGTSMVVWADGSDGTIGGGALEWQAITAARQTLATGRSQVLRIPLGPALGQCCGGAVTLAIEGLDKVPRAPWVRRIEGAEDCPDMTGFAFRDGWLREEARAPGRAIWVWGAGHVGAALVTTLAPMPDLSVTWIDDAADRFPNVPDPVTQLLATDMPRAMHHAPADADHIILTYSHDIDLALCHAALSHGFRSCGLIGSATKWARFRSRLGALGHEKQAIDRIACPIGNPAFGKHPQAIAVGVAASLLSPELSHGAAGETTT
ncbi:xanthine dehydrogenase accessory protein XdhC [Jannaschia donghaensis]|uniref:Xanthine dehydrogenase accessory protein XdhC n=1 Tax=Jannaschia donghaensis TaxID=420998 RepID=A0A0M6YI28_9RHOB|nr:xanthine dehydrogenase accessory protein XdhC [Jannaschia donghaensis]CTQ49574.1 xanthine dehydrogenase accessory protein XdhC [Jannaschia donghaensis]